MGIKMLAVGMSLAIFLFVANLLHRRLNLLHLKLSSDSFLGKWKKNKADDERENEHRQTGAFTRNNTDKKN